MASSDGRIISVAGAYQALSEQSQYTKRPSSINH